jgi:DNA-directed RNA polymerase subunit L
VKGEDKKMKTYLLRKRLEKGTKFAKYRAESLLGLHPLIKRAEIYIQYEKRLEANKIMIPNLEKEIGKKLERENKYTRCAAKYQHYTSLNISWDHIEYP